LVCAEGGGGREGQSGDEAKFPNIHESSRIANGRDYSWDGNANARGLSGCPEKH
jgi:hypothetical protein